MKHTRHVPAHHHENLAKHARALVSATQHVAEEKVADARAKLTAIIDDAKERWEDIEEKAADAAERVDDFVHEKPYHTAAIGVGIGAILGIWLARRK